MKFEIDFERLKKTKDKGCCLCEFQKTPENVCPCETFLKTQECKCMVFKKTK